MHPLQICPATLGEGHIRIYWTLQIGHTIHEGHQRLQCWPFPGKLYHGYNREDFVFTRPPGVERFVLNPDNVWYCRLKLLFTILVQIDCLSTSSVPMLPSAMRLSWAPLVRNYRQ